MAQETPFDCFKSVLGGASRTIAYEPEVELAFTADAIEQAYQGADGARIALYRIVEAKTVLQALMRCPNAMALAKAT